MFEKFATALVGFLSQSSPETKYDTAESLGHMPVPNLEYPGDECCTIYDARGYTGAN